ncbi:MAG: enoyl-CoA hydratase-related protein [Gemmatimonadetes bacterium]|nr:enoyl-CoA hydratase-related protein [Gemmatimonadota bacterium]
MSSAVRVTVEGPIAEVRLDGPEKHNVLDLAGWNALAAAFAALSARTDIRCVTVRGTGGRAFSAGSDISAFSGQRVTPDDVRGYSAAISGAMHAIRDCPHPTVALIEGICVGGGLEIAVCCDIRACEASSQFGAPINRLGLTMAYDELDPIVRLVGAGPALDLLLTGDLIPSAAARRMGLVSRVAPDGEVVSRGRDLAGRIAAGAPLVNRWHKKFIRRLADPAPLTEVEREESHAAFETDDYREGRTAFMEKRPPTFTGE